MKSRFRIAAAILGSFVLGVGAASVLHAQARLPAYVWAEVDIKDDVKDVAGYNSDFLPKALANIKESGGKFLAGRPNPYGDYSNVVGLNGSSPPARTALLQFADMEAVKAFFAKMGPLQADVGSKYASFRVVAVEGN